MCFLHDHAVFLCLLLSLCNASFFCCSILILSFARTFYFCQRARSFLDYESAMGLVDHTVGARQVFTHSVRIALPEPSVHAHAHANASGGSASSAAAASGDDAKADEPAAPAAATGIRVSWYFRSMKNDIKFGVEFRPADAPNVRHQSAIRTVIFSFFICLFMLVRITCIVKQHLPS